MVAEVAGVLLHPALLQELFLPQPAAPHAVIQRLLRDISAASIMKLDDYSVSKLWDLMTVIFKWQLAVAADQNIFDITRRHLRGVATLVPQFFQVRTVENAMRKFEELARKFTDDDYKSLNNTLILWFSEYHSKISVLMRLGLQNKDGTFVLPVSVDPKMLQNLGDNIYKYDNKRKSADDYENRCTDTTEISCLLSNIGRPNSGDKKIIELNLPIDLEGASNTKNIEIPKYTQFENINTNVKNATTSLAFNPNMPKSAHEDLLTMMEDLDLDQNI